MKRYLRLTMMVVGTWLTIGCSDNNSGGGSNDAIAKCDEVIQNACDYYARCQELANTQSHESAYNECLGEVQKQGKSCSNAVGTTDAYDTCLSEVKTASCPFQMPADCHAVISLSTISGGAGNGGSGGSAGTSSGSGGNTSPGGHAGTSPGGSAGTSSGGSAGTGTSEVAEKCQEYSSEFCHYAVRCAKPEQHANYDECIEVLPSKGVDCTTFKSVTSKFNDCISDLKTITCSDGPPLPDSCKGVFSK